MKRHSQRRPIQSGFTLVELLIVIAIIGILAAILFPVFGRIRETGRSAACSSNLKQLGLAFTMYTNDNGGRMPYAANYQSWGHPGGAQWVGGTSGENLYDITDPKKYVEGRKADATKGSLYRYVNSPKVYYCPSHEHGSNTGLTYSMNCAVSLATTSRISSASDVVLLVDELYPNDGWFFAWDTKTYPGYGTSTDEVTAVHNGGHNVLFVDGHAKAFQKTAFLIDESTDGMKNKQVMTGSPRFHDRQLGGKNGTAQTGFALSADGKLDTGVNSCAQGGAER